MAKTSSAMLELGTAAPADQPVSPDQRASTGCNIKWKSGNEPAYFSS